MGAIKKLILVTSPNHPLDKHFRKISERTSKELGIELEVRIEDYVFLVNHGDVDEFGMTWLPQLLAEDEDGNIIKVLTKPNLTSDGRLDEELDYKYALSKLLKEK